MSSVEKPLTSTQKLKQLKEQAAQIEGNGYSSDWTIEAARLGGRTYSPKEILERVPLLDRDQEKELADQIQTGFEVAIQKSKKGETSPSNFTDLNKQLIEGQQAVNLLICSNIRIAYSIANYLEVKIGVDKEEAAADGFLALMVCAANYDGSIPFANYAWKVVRGRVSYVQRKYLNKPSINVLEKEESQSVLDTIRVLEQLGFADPSPEKIANEAGVELEDVEAVLCTPRLIDIDAPKVQQIIEDSRNDQIETNGDVVRRPTEREALRRIEQEEIRDRAKMVKKEIKKLTFKQQEAINEYFFGGLNMNEISQALGVSKQAVSGRIGRGLEGLREIFKSKTERNGAEPIENRYTITDLCRELDKSYAWVKARLEKYQKLAEEIPDAGYNIRLHYPQEVLDELKAELSAIDREENNGSDGKRWYTTNQLCTETSKSYPWVKARLEKYQKLTEEMLDAKNNLRVHYPQEVLDKLLSELQNNGD